MSDNSPQATGPRITSSWRLRNGFRSYKRTDASEVARIETIGGPAAVRYGITQPGDIRNIITRQPTGKNSGLISKSHDSTDSERREGDFNVRLNDTMSRLIGACEQDIPEADDVVDRFKLFSPTFAWQLDQNTNLAVNAGWTTCAHSFAREDSRLQHLQQCADPISRERKRLRRPERGDRVSRALGSGAIRSGRAGARAARFIRIRFPGCTRMGNGKAWLNPPGSKPVKPPDFPSRGVK